HYPTQRSSDLNESLNKTIESLNKTIAEQAAKIHPLTEEVERLKNEKAVLQQSADTLARLREEVASSEATSSRNRANVSADCSRTAFSFFRRSTSSVKG